MTPWADVAVPPTAALAEAIARIDRSGLQVALVVDQSGVLLGILTDGNIRRAILAGSDLQTAVSTVMTSKPVTVEADASDGQILELMRRTFVHHVPVVDQDNRVLRLVTLNQLLGSVQRLNPVVIMAGGRGTRLQPLTNDRPKALIDIGGKPVLESILESFADQGFRRFFFSVNYKASMIRDYFASGQRWGVSIEYLDEDQPLGTAGALSLLPSAPDLPVVVMNGDLLTRTNFPSLLRFHEDQKAVATMAVREYDLRVPYGVVHLAGAEIERVEEKPEYHHFVNAGIYVLSSQTWQHLTPGVPLHMTELFERLIAAGRRTVAFPLREYWLDIGQSSELERARREWPLSHDAGSLPADESF